MYAPREADDGAALKRFSSGLRAAPTKRPLWTAEAMLTHADTSTAASKRASTGMCSRHPRGVLALCEVTLISWARTAESDKSFANLLAHDRYRSPGARTDVLILSAASAVVI